MKTIWEENCDMPRYNSLSGDISVTTLVIGAGMAGVLCAFKLWETGQDVIVIERGRVGCGQTRGTTAKITYQHGAIYSKLISKIGADNAHLYARANRYAVAQYAKIIQTYDIDCDFEVLPSYIYSAQNDKVITDEYNACKRLGLNVSLTDNIELPVKVRAALKAENQAQFSPLKFLGAIAEHLTIYENTPALAVDKYNVVTTPKGRIRAENIVVATHFPFINVPGLLFARMYQERSYVLALKNAQQLHGMYKCVDAAGNSFRGFGEYLLFGGGKRRTGTPAVNPYDALRDTAKRLYPQSQEVSAWSAQDCATADGVPYVGRFPYTNRSLYVITGFDKWGMTNSMASSDIIVDLICGRESPNGASFSPNKFHLCALPNIASLSYVSTKNICAQKFSLPKFCISQIEVGKGAVVTYHGRKLGVYRKSEDETYFVTTKCPHLGCELQWNEAELVWECPCHGSRFDYKGNLIDNPAQTNISHCASE